MSRIHNCWVLSTPRSVLSRGRARYSTLTSRDSSRVGSASTASPSQSRRVARSRVVFIAVLLWSDRRLAFRRTIRSRIDSPGLDSLSESGRQERPLGVVLREVQRRAVGGGRLAVTAEAAQQVGPYGRKIAVAGEPAVPLQDLDLVESGLRSAYHRHRHGPVERDDRRGPDLQQPVVEPENLAPVGGGVAAGHHVQRGDGGLKRVPADAAGPERVDGQAATFVDGGPIPGGPVLLFEHQQASLGVGTGGPAGVGDQQQREESA